MQNIETVSKNVLCYKNIYTFKKIHTRDHWYNPILQFIKQVYVKVRVVPVNIVFTLLKAYCGGGESGGEVKYIKGPQQNTFRYNKENAFSRVECLLVT